MFQNGNNSKLRFRVCLESYCVSILQRVMPRMGHLLPLNLPAFTLYLRFGRGTVCNSRDYSDATLVVA